MKTAGMTSKERIVAALEGRSVDHVPFSPFLAYVWEHFPKRIQDAGQLAFNQWAGADPMWRGAPCPVSNQSPKIEWISRQEGDRTHVEMRTPVGSLTYMQANSQSGHTCFLVEHPLKTEEDFKIQLWIEENTRMVPNIEAVKAHFAGPGAEGLSLGMLVPRGKSAYQSMIEHHVGTQELNYALIDFPDTVNALWQTMVQRDMEAVKLAMELDLYEYYITWEDSSTQNYSPTQYDAFIGSEIGEWCRVLNGEGRRYIQHACGHVKDLIVRMHVHGTSCIESISPPPTGNLALKDARAAVAGRMGIIGGIEPTHFLNLGEAELPKYVEQVIADGSGGPFVLANSDSCPPGVVPEKFKIVGDVAGRTPMNASGWGKS